MRYINLSNEKKRNAQLIFKSAPSPSKVLMVNVDDNKPLNNKRLLKFRVKIVYNLYCINLRIQNNYLRN